MKRTRLLHVHTMRRIVREKSDRDINGRGRKNSTDTDADKRSAIQA